LPSHGRTASIWLNLSGNDLRLSVAAAASMYEALAELVLDAPRLGGGGRTLRLHRLDIRSPAGLLHLVLAGVDALQDPGLSRTSFTSSPQQVTKLARGRWREGDGRRGEGTRDEKKPREGPIGRGDRVCIFKHR
jgi:hypothetical protein